MVCKYCDDCFKCPLPDCQVDANFASTTNQTDYDLAKKYTFTQGDAARFTIYPGTRKRKDGETK